MPVIAQPSPVRFLCLAASLAACPALPLAAAEREPSVGTVIVTATRYREALEEVLAPAIVIGREDLEGSLATDAGEALRFHAGIDVVRSGGPGQSTSVFMRGTESNHTLVLVDGVRINPGTIGSAALQNIAPELIERIEVVKGPRSTLYGSDAIGGVINIITRQERDPGSRFSTQVGVGPYATRQGNALGSIASERSSAGLAVSWLDSDGFPTRSESTTDRGFHNLSFSGNARTRIGELEAGVRYWHAEGSSEYSDFFLTPVDQDFRNSVAALDLALAPTARWTTRAIVSRVEDLSLQNQSDDRLSTERYAIDWQNDFEITAANRVTAGIVHAAETADALSYGTGFAADTDVTTAYLQNAYSAGRHEVLLAAGYTDHSTFGHRATWNAEYGIDIGPDTQFIASAGTAFRAPDATDRFGFGGNADLRPEASRQVELAVRHRLSARQSLRVNAFQNEIDDLIEYVVTDFDTFDGELRNVEEARIRGVELTWEMTGADWRVHAEASHQEPRNRTTGDLLLRRSRNSLAVSYVRSLGRVELGIDVLGVDEREDFGPVVLEAYAMANLKARYKLNEHWSVLGRLENVLDEQYELASGYNTPDRGLFVAVRFAPGQR